MSRRLQISQPFPTASSRELQQRQHDDYYGSSPIQQQASHQDQFPPHQQHFPQQQYQQQQEPMRPSRSVRRPNGQSIGNAPSLFESPNQFDQQQQYFPQQLGQQRQNSANSGYQYLANRAASPVSYAERTGSPLHQLEGAQSWDEERRERAMRKQSVAAAAAAQDLNSIKLARTAQAFSSEGKKAEARRRQESDNSGASTPQRSNTNGSTAAEQLPEIDDLFDTSDPNFREIDYILRDVKRSFTSILSPNFNPVTLALSLLSSSAPTSSYAQFSEQKRSLEASLKSSLSSHFNSFAASISTHNSFLASLSTAQGEIGDARKKLVEAKEALGTRRADLGALHSRQDMLKGMLKLLDAIERLKQVPEQLESLITEKKLLLASLILVRSLKEINKPEMIEIGAISDLRNYLTSQEISLREILIEELHNHLYLKSYYCEDRWVAYVHGQETLPSPGMSTPSGSNSLGLSSAPLSANPSTSSSSDSQKPQQSKLSQYLALLSMRPSQDPLLSLTDDAEAPAIAPPTHNRNTSAEHNNASVTSIASVQLEQSTTYGSREIINPESDNFAYIESLLEALTALGQLGYGLDVVGQRLPSEIYSLVEGTVAEVEERMSDRRRQSLAAARPMSSFVSESANRTSLFRQSALEPSNTDVNSETLKDMFWTLFSKLDAVLQGHRVVHEVAQRIGTRKNYGDASKNKANSATSSLSGSVMEIWRPIQTEVRTLLHAYLTDEEQGATSARNPILSINEVLRDGRAAQRDRTKQLFRFTDSDSKTTGRLLKRYDEELNKALKSAVPGLVNQSLDTTATSGAVPSMTTDERYAGGGTHKVLVAPDAFNVSILFQPTLAFLARVKEVMPAGFEDSSGSFNSFLDEFVVKVYLPQLEEKVSDLFQQAVGAPDAFEEDPTGTLLADRPLTKSTIQVLTLINSLCSMLRTTPFHRENYSRLIISVIVQYYQICSGCFRDIVTSDELLSMSEDYKQHLALASLWAQRTELTACMAELLKTTDATPTEQRKLSLQETRIEMGLKGDTLVEEEDLLQSGRKYASLGTLYRSLTWLMDQLSKLKQLSDDEVSSPPMKSRPLSMASTKSNSSHPADSSPQLPLTKAMSQRFDALLQTYEQLAQMVLFTMRLEIRTRIMHFMDLALRRGNYKIEQEAFEPDPHIIDMIADLAKFEEIASGTLPDHERKFVFYGLGALADHLLVTSSRYVRYANAYGVRKIMRNVLALQQSLKVILEDSSEADFDRGRQYWELFSRGSRTMLEDLRQIRPVFSFDEYKAMLCLQNGIPQDPLRHSSISSSSGPGEGNRKAYNESLIELHSIIQEYD